MQALTEQLTVLARGEAPGAMIWLMAIGFTVTCVVMMLVILIQKPKGGGLSGAFGGGAGGGSSQAFVGGGIGNVLTVVTVILFLAFLLLAGSMTLAINSGDEVSEEDADAEQVEDDTAGAAGAPAGETELPPVEPEVEAEPETEDAPDVGGDEPAVEGEAETEAGAGAQTPAEPAE